MQFFAKLKKTKTKQIKTHRFLLVTGNVSCIFILVGLNNYSRSRKSLSRSYLVEKVLYKSSYSNVVEVPVDQQEFGQELEPGNCIVAVSHSLTTLLPHDTWRHRHTGDHTAEH